MSALPRVAEWVRDIAAAIDAASAIRVGLPVSERARRRVAAARPLPRPTSRETTELSGRWERTRSGALPAAAHVGS